MRPVRNALNVQRALESAQHEQMVNVLQRALIGNVLPHAQENAQRALMKNVQRDLIVRQRAVENVPRNAPMGNVQCARGIGRQRGAGAACAQEPGDPHSSNSRCAASCCAASRRAASHAALWQRCAALWRQGSVALASRVQSHAGHVAQETTAQDAPKQEIPAQALRAQSPRQVYCAAVQRAAAAARRRGHP